jgi:hypothetical protein
VSFGERWDVSHSSTPSLTSTQHERPEIVGIQPGANIFIAVDLTPESPITESSVANQSEYLWLGDAQNETKLVCLMWKGLPPTHPQSYKGIPISARFRQFPRPQKLQTVSS